MQKTLEKIEKDRKLLDSIISLFPEKYIIESLKGLIRKETGLDEQALIAAVEEIAISFREQCVSTWIVTLHWNLEGKEKLRLERKTFKPMTGADDDPRTYDCLPTLNVKLGCFTSSVNLSEWIIFERFADVMAKEADKNPDGLPLSLGMILKKDNVGYYVTR